MQTPRLSYLGIIGAACCTFAVVWIVWLFLIHRRDFLNLLAVRGGDYGDPYGELVKMGLSRARAIRFTSVIAMVQLALCGVLAWTGVAMLRSWPSARWCVPAFGVFAVITSLVDTLVRLLWLTLPGELIKVSPLVMDAFVILFAVNLQAAVLTPRVHPRLQD